MSAYPSPLNLRGVKVFPLAQRHSRNCIEGLLIDPDRAPPECGAEVADRIGDCAGRIRSARNRGASVILLYGAHLVKNGAQRLVQRLAAGGWVTHLATNGAGTIHDWELSFLGRTEESVRDNVATGTFGTWDETGRYILLSLLVGGLREEGYGRSLGRFIAEDGLALPEPRELEDLLRFEPAHPLAAARAELLHAMRTHALGGGPMAVPHPWKAASILAEAFRLDVPMTVHPGIGYDIIATHPIFSGAAVGRAAAVDFALFGRAVDGLDGGVVLSVGSAIMAPQVFEKSLSCVNNLRLQAGRSIVEDHSIYVVDIQSGGGWDWSTGEPPKDNPAYYLRFCKSFARMGGRMSYLEADNRIFLHRLLHSLEKR